MKEKRFYDYKRGFKVKILDEVKSSLPGVRYLVQPYKTVENRNYVFKNNYIVYKKELLLLA